MKLLQMLKDIFPKTNKDTLIEILNENDIKLDTETYIGADGTGFDHESTAVRYSALEDKKVVEFYD